ncbi:MAG: MopE-related protein [Myxococcota bacterium]
MTSRSPFLGLSALAAIIAGCPEPEVAQNGELVISADSLDFGEVPVDTIGAQILTIENTGAPTFSVLSVSVVDGPPSLWRISGAASTELSGGDNLRVTINFLPTDLGQKQGQIQIRTTYEGSGGPNYLVDLIGVGSPSIADEDGDGVSVADGDCDDNDDTIFPGAVEACDGVDNNCDGVLNSDEVDADFDGFFVCEGDCNDAVETIFPGAAEICDGEDSDCDGVTQDNADSDADGYSICEGDCDDTEPRTNPGEIEVCDGIENDCVGEIDDIDEDGDGYSRCDNGGDCDDDNPDAFPVIVDPAAATTGEGTLEAPYATLEAGLTNLDAVCRTVVLAEGTYEVSRSWSDGAVVVVGAGLNPEDTILQPPENSAAFTVQSGGALTLRNLQVSGANNTEDGSALRVMSGGRLSLDKAAVVDNFCVDGDGGAILVSGGRLESLETRFENNRAGDDGGAIVVRAGGTFQDVGSMFLTNSGATGGAILSESSQLILDGATFDGNAATSEGGAISMAGGTEHRIERSSFWLNTAGSIGGAIAIAGVNDEDSVVRNNRIQDNTAAGDGGGIAITGENAALVLANNTFFANVASDGEGGGLFMGATSASGVAVWSNVLYANRGDSGLYVAPGSGASAAYNLAFLNPGADLAVGAGEDDGDNVADDPLFTDDINDGDPSNDDLSLRGTSPGVDSGPTDGDGPSGYTEWNDLDGSRNDRGFTGGGGAE